MNSIFNQARSFFLDFRNKLLPVINRSALPIVRCRLKLRCWSKGTGKRNHVVVLGDYLDFSSTLHHTELKEYNIVLVVTKRYTFAKLLQKFPENLTEVVLVENFEYANRESTKQKLVRFEPVAVLIQSGEFIVPTYNYLNREFGLGGNSERVSDISLSKKIMRDAMVEAGLPCVRYQKIAESSELDAVDYFPVVVKPTISTASMGVRLVESKAELLGALQLSKSEIAISDYQSEYIVEEYIEGRQFDFEGLILNGEPEIFMIVEECYQGLFPLFDHSWFLFNVPLDEQLKSYMCEVVKNTIKAVGIEFGAFHCEAKLTDKGELKIIEFSNRMGTGFEERTAYCTGIDLIGCYIRESLGKNVTPGENKNLIAFERYCSSDEEIEKWLEFVNENNVTGFSLKRRRFRTFYGITWIEGDFELLSKAANQVLGIELDQ